MADHDRGLYETLITEALAEQLATLEDRLEPRQSELHEAEAADRLALHLSRVVERAIASLDKNQRVGECPKFCVSDSGGRASRKEPPDGNRDQARASRRAT